MCRYYLILFLNMNKHNFMNGKFKYLSYLQKQSFLVGIIVNIK